MKTREEHMQWCKDRAMQYVNEGDFQSAVSSMLSDLAKHQDTARSGEGICAVIGMHMLMRGPSQREVADYIQGFN